MCKDCVLMLRFFYSYFLCLTNVIEHVPGHSFSSGASGGESHHWFRLSKKETRRDRTFHCEGGTGEGSGKKKGNTIDWEVEKSELFTDRRNGSHVLNRSHHFDGEGNACKWFSVMPVHCAALHCACVIKNKTTTNKQTKSSPSCVAARI